MYEDRNGKIRKMKSGDPRILTEDLVLWSPKAKGVLGKKRWNNGVIEKYFFDNPGAGWEIGGLKGRKYKCH